MRTLARIALAPLLASGCGAAPVVDAAASSAIDCATMETLAPGYELEPIATSFDPAAPPHGPRATPRAIAAQQVYRRTAVAQYGGAPDAEPPRPTLIAFAFDADSMQRRGSYCVVQATDDGTGGVRHGHYPITFVPGDDAWHVTATLGDSTFQIGFDGTARELTIYADAGTSSYLETYVAVPRP